MSKYTFERLGSGRFETLAQALLEKKFRHTGGLIQFGEGKDGAREATWVQLPSHESYTRPVNAKKDRPKQWVFQAKYHDIGLRGWNGARADVESDLHNELTKLITTYNVPCDKYVLITNVPFSGVRHVGTRDKVNIVIEKWKSKVPEIEVWDAVDLSRMLDADTDTRTTYLDAILPGDVLQALIKSISQKDNARISILQTYLRSIIRAESLVRAEEAGDESSLPLHKVYVDLNLNLNMESLNDDSRPLIESITNRLGQTDTEDGGFPDGIDEIPSSFAFMRADYKSMLLKGGPGVGKSTITQFLTLYHAARLVNPEITKKLEKRLKLSKNGNESLDSHIRVRFPIRVELRRYAQWIADVKIRGDNTFLGSYIADCIARASSAAAFSAEEVFSIASENPVLLILDGLDEVPDPSARKIIFEELSRFIDRCEGTQCDIQLLLSSRPQGYRGEFDNFSPVEWQVVDLGRDDFNDYTKCWLDERIPDTNEKTDARQRIVAGMESKAVQQMATTLLQATVMLTIAAQKHAIPHARHKLYEKYVDVIFRREQSKETVRKYYDELKRLHELVGYELIRRMQSLNEVQTLGGEEFEQCIRKVIEDFGPSDLGTGTISDIVESIVTLAKDRLCLIAGKGEDQENVDFIIQPIREYFAASYLDRHESAAPEKLYAALVSRQHIWGNVMQFYSAFQSTAQQKNWISEADGLGVDFQDFENVVEYARKRRALLHILPEFERPRNEYIERAFQNLLKSELRWSWKGRKELPDLLSAFAQNDAYHIAKKTIGDVSTSDLPNLSLELELLVKLSGERYRTEMHELLNILVKDSRLCRTVLSISLSCSIEIDVSSVPDSELKYVITDFRNRNRGLGGDYILHFWRGLSCSRTIDLLFKDRYRLELNSKLKDIWLHEMDQFFRSDKTYFHFGPFGILLRPFMEDRTKIDTNEIERNLVKAKHSSLAPYLLALVKAIKDPINPSKYQIALLEQEKCGIPDDFELSTSNQLGPPPEEVCSIEEWTARRKLILFELDQNQGYWHVEDGVDKELSLLFFHPSVWEDIHSIVEGSELDDLRTTLTKLYTIASFPAKDPPFRLFLDSYQVDLDPYKLCIKVANVLRNNGIQSISPDVRFLKWIAVNEEQRPSHQQAMEVLNKISGLNVPEPWSSFFIAFCAFAEGINASCIVDLWKQFDSPACGFFPNQHNESLLLDLLAIRSADADKLAAHLASSIASNFNRSVSVDVLKEISIRLCRAMSHTPSLTIADVTLLMRQIPVKDELRIWATELGLDISNEYPRFFEKIAERFREIVKGSDSDLVSLRNDFGVFINDRSKYPVELSVAALDAILQIDERNCLPLIDTDWK